MIYGISGYARAGKDTLAGYLVEEHGFIRASFAEALYEMLFAVDPVIPTYDNTHMRYRYERLQHIVERTGWERAKDEYPEVRSLLQRMGTDAGRAVLGENIWVDTAMSKLDPFKNYVFTDVRFPNEAEVIQDWDGMVVRITRPGFEPVNAHVSETALDDWKFDVYVKNDGPADLLREIARSLASA